MEDTQKMTLWFSVLLIFISGCGETNFSNEKLFEKDVRIENNICDDFHAITDNRL